MNESTSNKECKSCCRIRWGCAIAAGVVATIIMTVVMYFEGINITKMLGMMLMGSDASVGSQYFAGGVLHFGIGIFYGIVYAAIFAPLKMCTAFKAFIFGIIITGIAFFGMPIMASMLAGDGAANPCNPCSMTSSSQYNPCATHNPCNPCAMHKVHNPCNPCAMHNAANPCNPCSIVVVEEIDVMVVNPCALEREEEALAWEVLMVSFFNHFVFAFSLAFLYRMRKSKS